MSRPLITVRGGILSSSDLYQSNCGHSSLVIGAELRGRGTIFPWGSADRGIGSGGGDVGCGFPGQSRFGEEGTGGVRLEGSTMLAAGAGWRTPPAAVQLETVVGAGVMIGEPGFGASSSREVRPRVVGSVGLILFKHVVFSLELGRTQLSFRVDDATAPRRFTRWESIGAGRIGVRF